MRIKSIVTLVFSVMYLSCNSQDASHPAPAPDGFAVVELFTSEGCSSCPAADLQLAKINNEYRQNVYVMELHVDYWNHIGWKDEFSSAAYTSRQQHYARLFQLGSTYTPQAVVNGKTELAGSDGSTLRADINGFLKSKALHKIDLSAGVNGSNITVSYVTDILRNEEVKIALVQKKAETNVRRGENSGRKLQHINIVRSLTTVDDGKSRGVVNIALPQGLSVADVSVIAFVQNRDSWEITGAAQAQCR